MDICPLPKKIINPGRVLTVLLAVDDKIEEQRIRQALASLTDIPIEILPNEKIAEINGAKEFLMLIASYDYLKGIYNLDPDAFLDLMKRKWILVVVSQRNVCAEKCPMEFGHGLIFSQENLQHIAEVIQLCIGGYCVVPRAVLPIFEATRLFGVGIDRLSLKECAVLNELGLGVDDGLIAGHLGISEAAIKMLVRVVLSKLNLETRDDARIFSFNHREELQRIRRKMIWRSSDDGETYRQDHLTALKLLHRIMETPS